MSLKSKVTCFQCSKILNNPIELPCRDTICSNHLQEANCIKENKIKCLKCNQTFSIRDNNNFHFNQMAKLFLDEFKFLSLNEMILKKQIEDGFKCFYQIQKELMQSKNELALQCFDHFQELRRQIDLHREESKEKINDIQLKNKIDDIALDMIDKTKVCEASYSNMPYFNVSFKTIDENVNELNEIFRDPKLSLEQIKEIKSNQDVIISDLKSKLSECTKTRNRFKINELISCIDPKEFGQLYLVDPTNDPFKSQILSDSQQFDLIKLCEFDSKCEWKLIYRATNDGFGVNDFHSKCDNHLPTLCIFKVKQTGFIFGGYTEAAWDMSEDFKTDPNAFIFSLTNNDQKPCKMKTTNPKRSIYGSPSMGPLFGEFDICIAGNSNTEFESSSALGFIYKHPQYATRSTKARCFLGGLEAFLLEEIEVYEKV